MQLGVGVFVSIGVSPNEAGVEQSTASGGIGDGQWNSAEGSLVLLNGSPLIVVVNITVLGRLGEVELLNVLAETGWELLIKKLDC